MNDWLRGKKYRRSHLFLSQTLNRPQCIWGLRLRKVVTSLLVRSGGPNQNGRVHVVRRRLGGRAPEGPMLRITLTLFCRAVTHADVIAAYRRLGLPPGSSSDAVRQEYLKLARKNHPDINGGDESKMKLINLAYETVQTHGNLAAPIADNQSPGVTTAQQSTEPNQFKQKWVRRPSAARDNRAWNERSQYDWAAVTGVSADERLDPKNHPNAFNKFFSFEDDASLYQLIRSGATMEEAARALGKPEPAVVKRLDSGQFKQRIQRMLRKDGTSKHQHKNVSNPSARRVTRAEVPPTTDQSDGGVTDAQQNRTVRRPAAIVTSPMGRTYNHLTRFAGSKR